MSGPRAGARLACALWVGLAACKDAPPPETSTHSGGARGGPPPRARVDPSGGTGAARPAAPSPVVVDPSTLRLPALEGVRKLPPRLELRMRPRILGEPWTLDRRDFSPPRVPDALTVLGWSKDGRKIAFEVAADGAETRCAARRWLRVIDTAADRFVATEDVAHDDPDRDDCRAAELARRMAPLRRAALEAHGIEPGFLLAPAPIAKDGEGYTFTWPSGQSGRLRFEERFVPDDPYAESAKAGAAYRLRLERDGAEPLVLEAGRRRRPGVIGYRLEPGFVFAAPRGRGFAVFLVRMERALEGARWSWMANGAQRLESAARAPSGSGRRSQAEAPAVPAIRRRSETTGRP